MAVMSTHPAPDCARSLVPTPSPGERSTSHARGGKSNFLGATGNFSVQYNFTSASVACQVLGNVYAAPAWSDAVALAVVFIGAMLGMVCMGRLGDMLGRRRGMCLTTLLVMIGAVIPACAGGSSNLVYAVVCGGRLLLGFGVGGIYPLSAVHSAEGSNSLEGRGVRVSWAFFWQTPGVVVPYLIAMLLFASLEQSATADQIEFRLLFALGALPAMIVCLAAFFSAESDEYRNAVSVRPQTNVFETLRQEPAKTLSTLLGTAGSWFCYDVAYYGTSVFTPSILQKVCMTGTKVDDKCDQTLLQTSWQSVLVSCMGIPGCLIAIFLIDRIGSKRLNVMGFSLLSINFVAMGIAYAVNANDTLLFVLFCVLTFLLNFGPNLGTYVLPAVCFPAHIRSTCHGISGFGGKAGAVVGALMFPVVSNSSIGLPGVLFIQAVLCLLGAFLSQRFLEHDWDYLPEDDRIATESFVCGRGGTSVHSSPI